MTHSPDLRVSPFDGAALFRCRTPETALEQLGRGCRGCGIDGLTLSLGGPLEERVIASWSESAIPSGPVGHPALGAIIPGEPEWHLAARPAGDPSLATGALERAALLLEAWRCAREELARADQNLIARSRELDLLQSLARRAVEARTPADLFISTVSALGRGQELDLALAAYRVGASSEMLVFEARPFSDAYRSDVVRRAAGFLGWSPDDLPVPRQLELDAADRAVSADRVFREEDLILLPLTRKGQPIACLLVVPAGEFSERDLRLLYSSANQLSLHLDRILTVREAESDRLRTVVDSMPQGVLLADCGLRVREANRSARELFASGDLPLIRDLPGTLGRLGLRSLVLPILDGQRSFAEGEACLDDGRVWVLTASPLIGARGKPDGLVLVLTDITERRRLGQQLSQSEKMSSLGQMISGVAHELNNPLASILGYAQLLQNRSEDENLTRRLSTLGREAERCRRIVQNLLSFARQREPECKPLSLNQVVENVLSLLAYQLRIDDIRVERRLDDGLPVIQGDAHQLEQVLVNLLSNARQALRESGRPGTIGVSTRLVDPDTVVIEVDDDGPGIPDAIRHKIFDPFFTTKRPGHGTGLGLSLVYGIVAAHGGTIEARPRPAGGTTFAIHLPRGRAGGDEPRTPVAESTTPAFRAGRILVVDDEDPVAGMICEALAGDGHLTRSARDGRQALAWLGENEFDLVISDLRMPGMSGERLHEELCRSKPGLSRRLLLTTGDTFGSEPDEIAARTGLEVLSKPFDLNELRRRVRARLAIVP